MQVLQDSINQRKAAPSVGSLEGSPMRAGPEPTHACVWGLGVNRAK